ncbi:two pore domain potassium channel family protein [Candidatus Saccharibacteria bacterium]|jgi:voltage-gated potassium channel|nr:two pore domain potassium channel family protein [Candidatus Saccharibacteria bacterium]MCA9350867.1 two pore domain potassium channel family protein [Candidatus Saccharibacteria bacterium]MCB9839380.1 two pore domain potassium channel family protein [Candidatus Nomurabacteria bacterium]
MTQEELASQVKPFGIVLFFLVLLVVLSTIFFHEVEGWDYLNSYYFTIVTVATVGYGDFTPKTDIGKIGATVLIIIGIGLFSTFVSLLVKRRALKRVEHLEKNKRKRLLK